MKRCFSVLIAVIMVLTSVNSMSLFAHAAGIAYNESIIQSDFELALEAEEGYQILEDDYPGQDVYWNSDDDYYISDEILPHIVIPIIDFTLEVGMDYRIFAYVYPLETESQAVFWSSSDESVATISADGTVTAIAEGTAILTAQTLDGDLSEISTVFVIPAEVLYEEEFYGIIPFSTLPTSVSVLPTTATVRAGNTVQLTASGRTASGAFTSNVNFTWSSNMVSVARVQGFDPGRTNGSVTAVAAGTATITASTARQGGGTVSATSRITVQAAATTQVTITFNGNGHTGGTVPPSRVVNTPAPIVMPAGPTRTGFTFGGWRSSVSGNVFQAGQTVNITGSGTIRYDAVWTQVTPTLTLSPNTDWAVPEGGSTRTISVTANNSWTLGSFPNWVRVNRTSGPSGTTSLNLTVDRNNGAFRSGRFEVRNGTLTRSFNVSQAAAVHNVTNNITGTTLTRTTAQHGAAFSATLNANTGFNRPGQGTITMTRNGANFTNFTYTASTGVITIAAAQVTGNFVINGTAPRIQYNVRNDITGTTLNNNIAQHGVLFAATLNANTGFNRPSSITMTRNGLNFTNFNYTASTGVITIVGAQVTGNFVINGTAPRITHTVTFNLNGGNIGGNTANQARLVPHGSSINAAPGVAMPANPTRTNFTFTGWIITAGGSGAFTANTAVNGNKTVTAQWTPYPTVTFSQNFVGSPASVTRAVRPGSSLGVNMPADPTRAGFRFDGWWNTSAASGGTQFFSTTIVNANVDVWVRWTPTVTQRTVNITLPTGITRSGGGALSQTVNAGTAISTINLATSTGFTMPQSYVIGSGLEFERINNITARITGTPTTTPVNHTVRAPIAIQQHIISFRANGGSGSMPNREVSHGQSFQIPANAFTHTDRTFTGWNTQANGNGTAFADRATINNITGPITLHAQWTPTGGGGPGGCPGCGLYPRALRHSVVANSPYLTVRVGSGIDANEVRAAIDDWNSISPAPRPDLPFGVRLSFTTGTSSNLNIILGTSPFLDGLDGLFSSDGAGSYASGTIEIRRPRWEAWVAANNTFSREYLLRHEIGHFLGLGHPYCREIAAMQVDEYALLSPRVTGHDQATFELRFRPENLGQ